jgi:hypothetical protein
MGIIHKLIINYSLEGLRYEGGKRGGFTMTRATCYLCLQGRRPLEDGGK